MANRYSVASGLASAPSTWDGGASVPVSGDRVLISQQATGVDTFTTDSTGYPIGATNITVTGAVAAASYVVGEAVQFGTDPTCYKVTSWNSTTKVLSTDPIAVAIPSSPTIITARGHVVTLDLVTEWGDDSGATIVINGVSTTRSITVMGTLRASRTVSNSLTCRGNLALTPYSTLDYGRSIIGSGVDDQIPLGVSANLILNKSASPSSVKYGLICDTSGVAARVFFAGATRDPRARLTLAASAGATSITVDNVLGWQVGDYITISSSIVTNMAANDNVVISGAITGVPGAWVVPINAALTYAHDVGCPLGTTSSNVKVTSVSTTTQGYMNLTWASAAQRVNTREITYAVLANLGDRYSSSTSLWGVNISSPIYTGADCPIKLNNSTIIGGAAGPGFSGGLNLSGCVQRIQVNKCVIANNTTFAAVSESSGVIADFNDTYILSGNGAFNTQNSQGGVGCTHNRCVISGVAYVVSSTGIAPQFTDCDIFNVKQLSLSAALPGTMFARTKIGKVAVASQNTGQGALSSITYDTPTFTTTPPSPFCDYSTSGKRMQDSASANFVQIKSKNSDPTQQELYTPYAQYFRDNTTKLNGSSSLRADIPTGTLGAGTFALKVPASNGVPITLAGNLRFNAAYGSTNLPSVTLSGLGITPQTFACANTPDVWQAGVFTATQNSGYDGQLDLVFTTNSQNAGASAWFDGTTDGLFITWTRIYGYKFNEAASTKTIDPIIQQTNAAIVGAYTGIAIDTVAKTLTLTAGHTAREVYDYVHWYTCQAANITAPEFLTSTDGVNFALTYGLILSNAQLTGSGAINMPANTLTLVGTGGSALTIAHNAGVLTAVKLSGLVAGTRVQLWDVASNLELYNGVPGATLNFPITWTADKNIRIRAMYADAAAAKIFYEATATLYSTGLNLAINQVADTVYAANGINGALVAGITISDTLMLIEVAGGSITWAQIYAYETYWLTTAAGITDFARIIDAVDSANYILTSFKIKNVSSPTAPLVITGGYGRDSVTGLAGTLIDNTGGTIFCSPDNVISVKPNLTYNQFVALK